MASACVNKITMSPQNSATFPWLSPRISKPLAKSQENPDLDFCGDFEFRLDDPVNILPADQLFSDGKLVPLHLTSLKPSVRSEAILETRSPENPNVRRKLEISNMDPYLFSPKAPRCTSRWKDLLGLKKLNINTNAKAAASSNTSTTSKPIKFFRHRMSKSTGSTSSLESSLNLPLLPESEFLTSARLSLSSSSSGSHEPPEDLPRHSLDSDRLKSLPTNPPPRMRLVRHRTVPSENHSRMRKSVDSNNGAVRVLSADSPRMNSSGRVIFQGLERSTSSPGSFNGGPRLKYKGMERSYSANVRVTPVLNVPVCSSKSSVFGFQLFPNSNSLRKDAGGGSGHGGGGRGQVSRIRAEKA